VGRAIRPGDQLRSAQIARRGGELPASGNTWSRKVVVKPAGQDVGEVEIATTSGTTILPWVQSLSPTVVSRKALWTSLAVPSGHWSRPSRVGAVADLVYPVRIVTAGAGDGAALVYGTAAPSVRAAGAPAVSDLSVALILSAQRDPLVTSWTFVSADPAYPVVKER
jgi:hypothetical protein